MSEKNSREAAKSRRIQEKKDCISSFASSRLRVTQNTAISMPPDAKQTLIPKLRFPEFRNKRGWDSKVLGNQGEFLSSLTGKTAEHFGVGTSKYVTYMNVFTNAFTDMKALGLVDIKEDESQNALQVGDLLLTVSSETPGEAGMSSVVLEGLSSCYLNSFCTIFRFEEENRPNPHFLGYLMRQPITRKYFADKAQGSTRYNLSKVAFRNLPIAVPSPAEQQKIADCLSTLDERIGAESRKLDALKTHKKGLMQQIFPREGETLPPLRFPEFQNAPEWKEMSLGNYFDPIRNGFVGTATPYYTTSEGVRYLQGKNIKEGKIETDDLIFITADFHKRQRKSHLKTGDILMVQSGHVGECAIVDANFAGCNCRAKALTFITGSW